MRRAVTVILAVGLLVAACSEPPAPGPPPDWDFFGRVVHVEWTGRSVLLPVWGNQVLGQMEATLADGLILRFPDGGRRSTWCRPVDPGAFSLDYDNCWVAVTMDEQGFLVDSWETFMHGPKARFQLPVYEAVVEDAVVIRGIRFPLADDVRLRLDCCTGETGTLEEGIGQAVSRFDAETGEIDRVECYCRA
jgi:hypothetical protein